MLKLNYSEVGLYMERVVTSLELLIAQRIVLALRLGQTLYVESGCASFLLPADSPDLKYLEALLRQDEQLAVMILPVDDEFVEISLRGSWIAEGHEAHEGMFLVRMSDRTEAIIYQLWIESQTRISSLA